MKRKLPYFSILILSLCFLTTLNAQLSGWDYRTPIQVTELNGSGQTNYQVKLTVNTVALISAGHMQAGGEDIRFSDSCGVIIYNHYIDSNINALNTTIWVMVPNLPASGTADFYMYYGNATAAQGSNFANTFPTATIITSNTNITGTINADWFEITAGDTAFITAGSPVIINARNVIISGAINGNGKGFQGPAINTIGTGPGGGGTSTNSGCGGGSYGGVGGTGGLDAGDTPGAGGASYGTNNGTDVAMGSSGGSGTGISTGGNGGAALTISAEYISISGNISTNGNTAAVDGTGRGGGGGAGGGILLDACELGFSGTINADGGNGGFGTSTANDSGGGGGGGRIKGFNSGSLVNTGIATANGGIGGPNGTVSPGQPGTVGTVFFGAGTFPLVPASAIGAEQNIGLYITYSDTDFVVCSNENLTATANTGFDNYDFTLNSVSQASSAINAFTFTNLNNNDSIGITVVLNGCFNQSTGAVISVNPAPVVDAGTDQLICGGTSILLHGTGALNYTWNNGVVDSVSFTPPSTNSFIVTGTDVNGCLDMDTVTINVQTVDVSVTNNDPTLVANALAATFQWFDCNGGANIGGATSSNFTPTTNGNYGVIVTQNGCTDTSSCNFVVTLSLDEQNPNAITVYPNPSNGLITIQGAGAGNFVLINELGQPVNYIQLNDTNNYTTKVDFLKSGIYFIQSLDASNKYRSKIIITK